MVVEFFEVVVGGCSWLQMVLGGFRWFQVVPCFSDYAPRTVVGETFAVGVKNELDEGDGSFFCTYKRIDYRLIKAPTFKAALLLGEHDINGHQHYVARLTQHFQIDVQYS